MKRADKDGFVAVGDVPPQLLAFEGDVAARFGRPTALLPPDLLIPVSTLAYEVLADDRAPTAVPRATVAMHTLVLSDCRSLRRRTSSNRHA